MATARFHDYTDGALVVMGHAFPRRENSGCFPPRLQRLIHPEISGYAKIANRCILFLKLSPKHLSSDEQHDLQHSDKPEFNVQRWCIDIDVAGRSSGLDRPVQSGAFGELELLVRHPWVAIVHQSDNARQPDNSTDILPLALSVLIRVNRLIRNQN